MKKLNNEKSGWNINLEINIFRKMILYYENPNSTLL